MRAENHPEFNDWLIRVGHGNEINLVEIPKTFTESNNLIHSVFGDKLNSNDESMAKNTILTTKTKHANEINKKVLDCIEGEGRTYLSSDSIVTDDPETASHYTSEFLESTTTIWNASTRVNPQKRMDFHVDS